MFILAAVICAALSAVSCTEDTNYDEINDKKTALIEYGQALKSLIVPWELWDDDACDGSRLQRSRRRHLGFWNRYVQDAPNHPDRPKSEVTTQHF